MAQVVIQYLCDAETGHQEVFLDLFSEVDTTAQEHESTHRQIVDRLLQGGTFQRARQHHVEVSRNLFFTPPPL